MRTAALLFALALASPAPAQPVRGLPGASVERRPDHTLVLDLGRRGRLTLPDGPEGPCAPCVGAAPKLRLFGRSGASLALVVLQASRPHGGSRMCGAGEEETLHMVSLAPRPRVVASVPLNSCWWNVEGGAQWDAALKRVIARTSRVVTLPNGELADQDAHRAWDFASDGTILEVPSP